MFTIHTVFHFYNIDGCEDSPATYKFLTDLSASVAVCEVKARMCVF